MNEGLTMFCNLLSCFQNIEHILQTRLLLQLELFVSEQTNTNLYPLYYLNYLLI